jgi:glutamate-ammonia-ligase adenylyltransferase
LTDHAQSKGGEVQPDIEFLDSAVANRHLARVKARLAPETSAAFLTVLSDSADPDSVALLFSRLLDSAPTGLAKTLKEKPALVRYTTLIFGNSVWLGETLIQNPDLFRRLANRGDLHRCLSREDFRDEFARFHAWAAGSDLGHTLARFRKREYVRILLRELLGVAKLAETTEEISQLADSLIEEALVFAAAQLAKRYGPPRWMAPDGRVQNSRFAVVSLGKLGGNELNYSSDVDLMFLYDGGVEPAGAAVTNREYFVQLAQKTTDLLARHSRQGQVFRVDLRLRPQGHEGELAVALPRAIQYYNHVAEDWELQAMLKARHCAGDALLTREFIRSIGNSVYRPNINFAAIKTALQSRELIDNRGRTQTRRRPSQAAVDVKVDRGGIRDIEFLVQCLQRVYGGDETWLRSRGTLFALQKLHDKEHVSGKDFHRLTKAYEFLRRLEHLLQLRHGLQAHQLPEDAAELKVLARQMSQGEALVMTADDFVAQVQSRMAAVAEVYRRVVYQEQSSQFIDTVGNLRLQMQAPVSPESSYSQIMQRLAMDAPRLLASIRGADLSPHGRRNLDRFLNSAATSSERYGAVVRAPQAVERALLVFEQSEYLTDSLVRYPVDIELLGDLEKEPSRGAEELIGMPAPAAGDAPDSVSAYLAANSRDRMEAQGLFRQQYRRTLLAANARWLSFGGDIWHLLSENSAAADKALQFAFATSNAPSGFAVMALGRLGSGEFDLLSDADLLFVSDEAADAQQCRRAAERIVEFLTSYTRDGTVFSVDARLRPQGREGDLVTTPSRLGRYFSQDAKPWEAISYLRLRLVAGDPEISQRALDAARAGVGHCARQAGFAAELRATRERLEATDHNPNLKTGPGGTYDIDYLAGQMQAANGVWSAGNLADRVALLEREGLVRAWDAQVLAEHAAFLRQFEHCVRMVTARAEKWLPQGDHAQAVIAQLMDRPFQAADGPSLAERLTAVLGETGRICRQYLFD